MNEKKLCAVCGEEHDIDDMTCTAEGDYVCEDCRDENYAFCENCEEWTRIEYTSTVHALHGWRTVAETWCHGCVDDYAAECDDCGELWREDDMRHDDWDTNVCESCYDDRWRTCYECGALLRDGDAYSDDDEDEFYCATCWRDRGMDAIRNYGYKPSPIFAARARENGENALKFGIELEVDNGDDAYGTAREVTEAAQGRIYCKRDGSLDSGFEIVTHPATLAYHLYDFRWANIMRICKQGGFKSHDTETCGLHIHVGRMEMGGTWEERDAVSGKLVLLASALRDDLTKFSRRKADNLDRWAKFPHIEPTIGMSEQGLINSAIDAVRYDRYQAVNLRNDSTVEFRIFRGTLKRDTLAASLQLVSNLCKYAMTHTAHECLSATFVDIVNVDPTYVLLDYCQSRRLTTRQAS